MVRLALAVAYPFLAHAAALSGAAWLSGAAIVDLALLLLVEPLVRGRPAAWAALACTVLAAAWIARGPHALLPLLLAPPVFVALVAGAFARTLRGGRVPLVGRIAATLEGSHWETLPPAARAYARRVTLAWALLLAALAAADLALALFVVPAGIFAQLRLPSPVAIAEAGWSWFANVGDYLVIGGFLLAEYAWRRRRFPERAHGLWTFLRRMARLGPSFWREALQ
jgi:uncharacterized membrane protein